MNKLKNLPVLFALIISLSVFAKKNPGFYVTYLDNELVAQATKGNLTSRLATGLLDENVPAPVKAAVIDALASSGNWNKTNVETFKMFLARTTGESFKEINYDNLSGQNQFVLGYLIFADPEGNINEAVDLLKKAKDKLTHSKTVNTVYLLTTVNKLTGEDKWCEAKKIIQEFKDNTSLNNDFKQEAVTSILNSLPDTAGKCN